MKMLVIAVFLVLPLTAVAGENQSTLAAAAFIETTPGAPGGVVGNCLAAFGISVPGFSFGTNRGLKVCMERELLVLLFEYGKNEEGMEILMAHFADWQKSRISNKHQYNDDAGERH